MQHARERQSALAPLREAPAWERGANLATGPSLRPFTAKGIVGAFASELVAGAIVNKYLWAISDPAEGMQKAQGLANLSRYPIRWVNYRGGLDFIASPDAGWEDYFEVETPGARGPESVIRAFTDEDRTAFNGPAWEDFFKAREPTIVPTIPIPAVVRPAGEPLNYFEQQARRAQDL